MKFTDPIAVYHAESNIDAKLAQDFLEDEGIKAFAVEDISPVDFSPSGTLSEIHKLQVWVNRSDEQRATKLLEGYKQREIERNVEVKVDEPETIEVACEDCDQSSVFAGSLNGTIQDCPHCGSFS